MKVWFGRDGKLRRIDIRQIRPDMKVVNCAGRTSEVESSGRISIGGMRSYVVSQRELAVR